MNAKVFLRTASVIAFLQFAGHTLLHVRARATHGPSELAVLEAMTSQTFNFMGSRRSYWDFYFGYGLFAALNCLIESILFWQLATIVGIASSWARPVVALFFVANILYAALAWRYFFITPIIFDIAIAACLALAFVAAGSKAA